MALDRRSLLVAGALAGVPAIIARGAKARAALPDKAIRIFIGFEAGGGAYSVAQAIAGQLQMRLGRHVSVESRTGSYGALPGEIVRKGPADGSELALLSSTSLVSRLASKDFPFDPINDLAPVTQVGNFSIAFAVSPALGIGTFGEYLRWLKSGGPDRRKIAVSSNTAFVQVLNNLIAKSTGETLQAKSYRGVIPMVGDLQDGRIPACVNTITSLLPLHRGGRCRILFTTSGKRLAIARDIPTATELGYPKLDMREFFAFFAAPATPAPILAAWNHRLRATIEDPAVVDELTPLGLEVETSSQDALTARIDAHQREWQARMTSVGMSPVD